MVFWVLLRMWFHQVMQTANPRKRRKRSFIVQQFAKTELSLLSPFSERRVGWEALKILHKSLQTLNLTLKMCCSITVRSKATVPCQQWGLGIKMSGLQRWLQKHALSGCKLLVGTTHEQGEKLNSNRPAPLPWDRSQTCSFQHFSDPINDISREKKNKEIMLF